jgi:hypothetical protein
MDYSGFFAAFSSILLRIEGYTPVIAYMKKAEQNGPGLFCESYRTGWLNHPPVFVVTSQPYE